MWESEAALERELSDNPPRAGLLQYKYSERSPLAPRNAPRGNYTGQHPVQRQDAQTPGGWEPMKVFPAEKGPSPSGGPVASASLPDTVDKRRGLSFPLPRQSPVSALPFL